MVSIVDNNLVAIDIHIQTYVSMDTDMRVAMDTYQGDPCLRGCGQIDPLCYHLLYTVVHLTGACHL